MNKRKLGSFALFVMFFVLCNSVEAQQPKKVPRTGYLSSLDPNSERAVRRQFGWLCVSVAT